jgi:acyl-coenzyme A thioesterase PaaI-like protein
LSEAAAAKPPANFWEVPEEGVRGAWAEKRRLAAALRELVSLCVTTSAPEAVLREAADRAHAIADSLVGFPAKSFQEAHRVARDAADVHEFADRNVLVGHSNPLAPPMRFHTRDGESVGEVTFGAAYEGAPGWVHGGIVAAAFDQLFGHLQVSQGVPSLTGNLTIHYRRGTPLHTPLTFTAHVERREGRRNHVVGRCLARGEVTAESESVFVEVDPARMREMFKETADSLRRDQEI